MKRILFAIFILALFLRLFAVVTQEESGGLPLGDAKQYDNIAVNILSGNGLSEVFDGPRVPTSKRPPIYPLFLAGIYAIFGHNYFAVKVIQAIIGGIFCIVVFFIAYTVYADKRIAIISSFLTAIYRPFISGITYYGGPARLLSEYLYMFILGIATIKRIIPKLAEAGYITYEKRKYLNIYKTAKPIQVELTSENESEVSKRYLPKYQNDTLEVNKIETHETRKESEESRIEEELITTTHDSVVVDKVNESQKIPINKKL